MVSASVFPEEASFELAPEESSAISGHVTWRDSSSSEFLELQRQLVAASDEFETLRHDNNTLMHQHRSSMRELKEALAADVPAGSDLSENAAAEAAAKLAQELRRSSIIRNIFQV